VSDLLIGFLILLPSTASADFPSLWSAKQWQKTFLCREFGNKQTRAVKKTNACPTFIRTSSQTHSYQLPPPMCTRYVWHSNDDKCRSETPSHHTEYWTTLCTGMKGQYVVEGGRLAFTEWRLGSTKNSSAEWAIEQQWSLQGPEFTHSVSLLLYTEHAPIAMSVYCRNTLFIKNPKVSAICFSCSYYGNENYERHFDIIHSVQLEWIKLFIHVTEITTRNTGTRPIRYQW
jgi:hypothetical protein